MILDAVRDAAGLPTHPRAPVAQPTTGERNLA